MVGEMFAFEDFMGYERWLDKQFFGKFQVSYKFLHGLYDLLTLSKVFDTFIRQNYDSRLDAGKLKPNEYCITALEGALTEISESNWDSILSKNVKVIMMATCKVERDEECPMCGMWIKKHSPDGLNVW